MRDKNNFYLLKHEMIIILNLISKHFSMIKLMIKFMKIKNLLLKNLNIFYKKLKN